MKISIIGPSYPFRGGISHYTTLLYKNLKRKHETQFYAFKRQYPQWLFSGETDKDTSGNPIKEEGVENILDSLNPLTWWQVFQRIKKHESELVILPWWIAFWAPQFWTIASLTKTLTQTKILFICHNVVEHESNMMNRACTKLVLKKGDYFIVHSQGDLENLKKIKPDANIKQTFHPTYEVFRSSAFTKGTARTRLGIEGNIILFFGFIRPYKGLKYLLEAMPIVTKKVNVKLLIVGEFWDKEEKYRKQINNLGLRTNVEIINRYVPNEEVGLYFAASDLVVLPYVSATGSGIVQAALGCNRPVVTTSVGCLPEVISHGQTGYLVPPRNPQAIANAVISFYAERKEKLFVKNIIAQKERFSWDSMVDTIESLNDYR